MRVGARFLIDDTEIVTAIEIHRFGQFCAVKSTYNQGRGGYFLGIPGLHTDVSGSPKGWAPCYIPGGFRSIDNMITGTGSNGGPVVDVLKRVPVVLSKNRAPKVLPG